MIGSVKSVSVNPSASINNQNEEKIKQKKKQFVSQVEGEFYCTYMIDANGSKILINKIPINQMEEQGISLNDSAFEKIKKTVYHKTESSFKKLESKQQATLEATCKNNTQEMMEMLKSCAGIPSILEYKRNLKS